MTKYITVKELREQLENLEKGGYANAPIYYMDEHSMVYVIEEGLHDIWRPTAQHPYHAVIIG